MGDISAKEYNEKYRWDCDGAYCFVKGLEHAMQKSGAYEEAMHQLRCMGWPECQETLLTAIEVYREVVKSKIPGHSHYEFRHVVHCKDCKHWQESVDGVTRWCPLLRDKEVNADDFCSYGERKDNE
jgi:hypothetical protein